MVFSVWLLNNNFCRTSKNLSSNLVQWSTLSAVSTFFDLLLNFKESNFIVFVSKLPSSTFRNTRF